MRIGHAFGRDVSIRCLFDTKGKRQGNAEAGGMTRTVCFSGKSSSGSSFKPMTIWSVGASTQEPVGTRLAPVPSYSESLKMRNGDRSTLTVYPASTSDLAITGETAERYSSGFVSARTCRIVEEDMLGRTRRERWKRRENSIFGFSGIRIEPWSEIKY